MESVNLILATFSLIPLVRTGHPYQEQGVSYNYGVHVLRGGKEVEVHRFTLNQLLRGRRPMTFVSANRELIARHRILYYDG